MRIRNWIKGSVLLTAMALVVAACATTTEEPAATTEGPAPATPTTKAAEEPAAATTEAPKEDIKIGLLTSLTATFAPWGVSVADGMRMAVEEINAAGGANGHKLVLVEADTQSNAEEAVKALERMVEDGVVAAGGPISSDVGLNTSIAAEELQVPLFLVKAGSGAILTRDSRYTFRTCLPAAPMTMGPIRQWADQNGATKIGAIIADYGWGRAIEAALLSSFEGSDIEVQIEVAPIGETDFTTYLRSLNEFGPEMIAVTGHPPGAGAITVQSADLGFDVPVAGAWFPLSLIMGGGAAEAAVDRFADFGCADYDSESYQDLARRYLAFSDNVFMEDDAVAGYGIVTMVADAIANVGPDPVAIAEYLHGQSYNLPGYAFEMAWTEWGELAKAQPTFVIMRATGAPEGVNDAGDWWPELLIHSDPLKPYVPEG
ncbi:MAG: ABC transporter substrate-binding protein [Acidimicrobiia bacterium]